MSVLGPLEFIMVLVAHPGHRLQSSPCTASPDARVPKSSFET